MDCSCVGHAEGTVWAQLLGIGLVWVAVHCSGMCGPIVGGLIAAADRARPHASPARRAWVRARHLLAYQAGRASVYAALGAVAGLVGVQMESLIKPVTSIGSIVAALGIAALAALRLAPHAGSSLGAALGRHVGVAARAITRRAAPGYARTALFGAAMAVMPCMLMFWTLSLAIASADPLEGAALMVTLVAMTTPVLLAICCVGPLALGPLKLGGPTIVTGALVVSAIWMALVAAAANQLIPHAHLAVPLGGTHYTIMFW